MDSVLERQPQTKLQLAHRGSRSDHAKGGRSRAGGNRVTRLSEVHDVEGIRTIGPEAQPEAFAQTEVARESQINDLIARSIKEVSRRVAIGGDAGYDLVLDKGRGVEPLAAVRLPMSGSPINCARSLVLPSRFASTLPLVILNGRPLRILMIGEMLQPLRRWRAKPLLPCNSRFGS